MALCRFRAARADLAIWGWAESRGVRRVAETVVGELLLDGYPLGLLDDLADDQTIPQHDVSFMAPLMDGIEVWAAGVTYESSKLARMAESAEGGDFYARVYTAERPELFFKATPNRCVGPGAAVRIRADSSWNVPEPELAVVVSANGRILGYTIGNDMSSRDIEGANPLYLPQAKVYSGSCALGPWIVPADQLDPQNLAISLTIQRGCEAAFRGETSTSRMRRTVAELVEWLFRENEFPHGVILLTGTGIIPPDDFTLHPGDEVAITIEGIGTLRNVVA